MFKTNIDILCFENSSSNFPKLHVSTLIKYVFNTFSISSHDTLLSNELILAGKLQLKKLQKIKSEKKKIQASTELEPVPPRYRLGATNQLSYETTCWERGKF